MMIVEKNDSFDIFFLVVLLVIFIVLCLVSSLFACNYRRKLMGDMAKVGVTELSEYDTAKPEFKWKWMAITFKFTISKEKNQ